MFLTLCRPLVNERLREIIIMHGCVTLRACLLQCSAAENRCDYNQTKLHSRETIYPHLRLSRHDTPSLHRHVPAQLLPEYLGGEQDCKLDHCVTQAKELESHFSDNIQHAR